MLGFGPPHVTKARKCDIIFIRAIWSLMNGTGVLFGDGVSDSPIVLKFVKLLCEICCIQTGDS